MNTDPGNGNAGQTLPPATLFGDMSREEQVLVSTMGAMEHLIDLGMITGPKLMTEKGRNILAQLKASGFKATPEETEWAMRTLFSPNAGTEPLLPEAGVADKTTL